MPGPFPYSNNIPQSTDQISQSQPLLLQNFQSIKLLVDQNHGDFNSAIAGQHTYVQIPQTVVPGNTPNEVGLYNVQSAGVNQMWIRKADGTPDTPLAKSNQNQPGYSYLPSGILIQWGLNTSALPNPTQVFFPIAFKNATVPFAIFVTPAVTSAPVPSATNDPDSAFTVLCAGVGAPTKDFFYVMVNRRSSSSGSTQNNRQFYWFAIGIGT